MLKIKESQQHQTLLNDRQRLIRDIEEYLEDSCPQVTNSYPRLYLLWAINDSIEIASPYEIDDVYSMRLFVRLRWDIAPGYFKQPDISRVLSQTERSAAERFDELATDDFGGAWEAACSFDGPDEWRNNLWRSKQ